MTLRLATWNINSVRLRIDQVARFVEERAPDVLMLQEIKCTTDQFPRGAFEEMGMPHLRVAGQKGWHGVAIASRLPLEDSDTFQVCKLGHARCVSARVAGIDVQNFYIPAGGDVPDRALNPKFDHKMDFYEQLTADCRASRTGRAPGHGRRFQHRAGRGRRLEPPLHVQDRQPYPARGRDPEPASGHGRFRRRAARRVSRNRRNWPAGGAIAPPDFRKSNRGLRLDHIWTSPGLTPAVVKDTARIHDDVREWERPSDHAPVTVDLDV